MWWDLIFRFKKQLFIIGLAVAAFGSGWWYGVDSVEPVVAIAKKSSSLEKKIEKKDESVKTVTKIVEKKDGSRETVITQVKNTKSSTKTAKKTEKRTTPKILPPLLPNRFRSGITLGTNLPNWKDGELDYGVSVGLRAFGDFWLEGQYFIKSKNITVGVSVEF